MHTKNFYLIGNPVEHSLSPIMQRLFFEYYKIDAQYNALCVNANDLKSTLYSLKNSGANGINVTVPYKESIIDYLDVLSDEALAIGSVNTIKFSNGTIEGYNTDFIGFQRSLPISIENENVVILGAGGAARAILLSLANLKCRNVVIFNRTFSRAEKLVQKFQKRFLNLTLKANPLKAAYVHEALQKASLLINTTTVGMKTSEPNQSLVDPNSLHKNLIVYDLVYNPLETPLIQTAREKGLCFFNGLDMLIYQGLESLKIWIGDELPFADSLINQTREVLMQELNVHG